MVINREPRVVFAYLSDYTKDHFWRKEINETEVNPSEMKVGANILESSFLSGKVPRYQSALTCTDYIPNQAVTIETVAAAPFWARSIRGVILVSENKTEVTYSIQFDMAIVKHGLGFQLPKFLVQFYTKATMKKYLKVLKHILENQI